MEKKIKPCLFALEKTLFIPNKSERSLFGPKKTYENRYRKLRERSQSGAVGRQRQPFECVFLKDPK